MVLQFVLFHFALIICFDSLYSCTPYLHTAIQKIKKIHGDQHCHGWLYYVVQQKYGYEVCMLLFNIYSTYNKVYIHLICIITHQQKTSPFDSTHVLSSSNHWTSIMYQWTDNCSKENRNSDVKSLLHPYLTIRYCNQ